MSVVEGDQIRDLRAFNRFYTSVMGFLDRGLLRSEFTLSEARVIYELAQQEKIDAADLRGRMTIDAGQLSRIVSRLESAAMVERSRSESDGELRRRRLRQKHGDLRHAERHSRLGD